MVVLASPGWGLVSGSLRANRGSGYNAGCMGNLFEEITWDKAAHNTAVSILHDFYLHNMLEAEERIDIHCLLSVGLWRQFISAVCYSCMCYQLFFVISLCYQLNVSECVRSE